MPASPLLTLARRGLLLSVALAAAAPAASYTWQVSLGDGDWNNPANWQLNAAPATTVPGPGDSANFTTVTGTTPTTPHTITVATPVTVADLGIQRTGMTLDVPVGSSLTVTRPGGIGFPVNNGMALNGGTLNAYGTVTATGFVFGSGRVNGLLQFADNAVGSLYLSNPNPNINVAGSFRFNGRGEIAGNNIVAGLDVTARQVNAATPGVLTLFASAPPMTTPGANFNYGTITLDAAPNVVDSNVSIVTTAVSTSSVINYGTIKLNAGGSGTNTRTITGNLNNYSPGVLKVASGVSAVVTNVLATSGKVIVDRGATLSIGNYSSSPTASVTQIDGVLNTPFFAYKTTDSVSGTVNLVGFPVYSAATTRIATIDVANPTVDGTFVFHGGGALTCVNNTVPARITIVGQPPGETPTTRLYLTNPEYTNYGTITLAGNNRVNSSVSLYFDFNGSAGLNGRLTNHGALNLNAGGTGTNTRSVLGTVANQSAGSVTVAGGVTASISKELSNAGRVTIADGGVLSVPVFSQTGTAAYATIDGTLTAGGPNFTAAYVRDLLLAGRASNFTTGPLRTSTARGLGYTTANGLVTIKPAFYGDADLDGGVSINDFNALAANFGQGSGKVWTSGDFDYDGGVSINDFNLLAAGFGQSLNGPAAAADYSGLLAFAAAHDDLDAFAAVTGVPEPAGGAALLMAAAVATRGRHRRRHGRRRA